MAIMKLSNVPELTEFAGTEKIYVNDNGETKQIACDKVVCGERIILDVNEEWNVDDIISVMENGDNVWVKDNYGIGKILSYSWRSYCGNGYFFMISYIADEGQASVGLNRKVVAMVSGDTYDRLNNFIK